MYEQINLRLSGIGSGILLHNNRSVNPTDSFARYFKSHTPKSSDSDQKFIDHHIREWFAYIYTDKQIDCSTNGEISVSDEKLIIPHYMIQACFRKGASALKSLGKKFSAGVMVSDNSFLMHSKVTLSLEEQANVCRFQNVVVVNKTSSIIRVRPYFTQWYTDIQLDCDTQIINKQQIIDSINIAGRLCGLGDWRPNRSGIYGRFEAKEI